MKPSKPTPSNLPTKREVIACLLDEISMYQQGCRDGDGITRRGALHAIRCLEVALLLVRSKFPRVKRGR